MKFHRPAPIALGPTFPVLQPSQLVDGVGY